MIVPAPGHCVPFLYSFPAVYARSYCVTDENHFAETIVIPYLFFSLILRELSF